MLLLEKSTHSIIFIQMELSVSFLPKNDCIKFIKYVFYIKGLICVKKKSSHNLLYFNKFHDPPTLKNQRNSREKCNIVP